MQNNCTLALISVNCYAWMISNYQIYTFSVCINRIFPENILEDF